MDLLSSLRSGRESILTHGVALATTADNISNVNTVGYKGSRPEFADLYAGGTGSLFGGPVQTGSGVAIDRISTRTEQGAVETTGRPLDLAIQGNGYYILQNGSENLYTRAGNFNVNEQGQLISADNYQVMGFTAESPETPVPLVVTSVAQTATPTTQVGVAGNLNTASDIVLPPAAAATWTQLADTADFRTSVQVFDSLGEGHDITMMYFHTAPLGWTAQAYVDGEDVGGVPGTPVAIGTATPITFTENGVQAEGAAASLPVNVTWPNGSAAQAFAIDLAGFSGFASPSYLSSVAADGNAAGALVGTEILPDGTVNAVLDNQERVAVGTVALATFQAAGNLQRIGDNNFRSTVESGAAEIGIPDIEGRGSLAASSLENSNVDLASEFVDVIRFQRAYQAGSQVIQTSNDLLNTTIQIA